MSGFNWWRRLVDDVRTLRELVGQRLGRGLQAGQTWAHAVVTAPLIAPDPTEARPRVRAAFERDWVPVNQWERVQITVTGSECIEDIVACYLASIGWRDEAPMRRRAA